ncbi:hypothetical protein TUM4438_42240 [Shewanella sairae]|uniref:Chromosome partitioning protein ParB n=1 Tax=Shewanella sairae TaxID=190310 RepID=A0ABQ4PQV2_9GAMM|nr:hypothetical protein [Shewanella sairae]MCL1132422.1 hypothetical protein [Shewanella sairae]GIU51701.1 hypothetical protein TUM4438_42240 [Shewanella sairae]
MNTKVKISPPNSKAISPTEMPASARTSSSVETKNIQFKVSPQRHNEIKSYAAERGLSIKDLFLKLFDENRMI